jgi:hypothetical protein
MGEIAFSGSIAWNHSGTFRMLREIAFSGSVSWSH